MADINQAVKRVVLQRYAEYKIYPNFPLHRIHAEVPVDVREHSQIKIPEYTQSIRFFDRIEAMHDSEILYGSKHNFSGYFYFGERIPLHQHLNKWRRDFEDNLSVITRDKEEIRRKRDEFEKDYLGVLTEGYDEVELFLGSRKILPQDQIVGKFPKGPNVISLDQFKQFFEESKSQLEREYGLDRKIQYRVPSLID